MLYRKYRPNNFEEVIGQENTVTCLKNAIILKKLHHAILFCGPRGLGKTTLARILSKCVNCLKSPMTTTPCLECESCKSIAQGNFVDVIEIDAASNRGIDEIRELKEKINYRPALGVKKIYIIDEVHMLTSEAFNALLKTLEEPPEHVMFILATTDPEKMPETILSRCQRFDLNSVKYSDLKRLLEEILIKEGILIENEVFQVIFKRSGGSIRDSLSLLEKLILSSVGEKLTLQHVEKDLGLVPEERFQFFENIVLSNNISKVLEFIDEIWFEGTEVDEFFKQYCYYLKKKGLQSQESNFYWIEEILSVLFKLKSEEDKRLVGYVIVQKIRELSKPIKREAFVTHKEQDSIKRSKDISLEEILSRWDEFLKLLKRKKIVLLAYLSGGRVVDINNEKIIIEFPIGHQFHVDALKKGKNKDYIEEMLLEVYNMPLALEPIFEHKEVFEVEDNLLQSVMDVFGGEIVTK